MCLTTLPRGAGRSRNTLQERYVGARSPRGGNASTPPTPVTGKPREDVTILSAARPDQPAKDRMSVSVPAAAASPRSSQISASADDRIASVPALPRWKPVAATASAHSVQRLAGAPVPGPARSAGVPSGGILMRPPVERRKSLRPQPKGGTDGFMSESSSFPRVANFGGGQKPLRPQVKRNLGTQEGVKWAEDDAGNPLLTKSSSSSERKLVEKNASTAAKISSSSSGILLPRSTSNIDVSYRPKSRNGKQHKGSGYQPALPSNQIIPPTSEYEIPAQIVDKALGQKSPGRAWLQIVLRDVELVAKNKLNLGKAIRRLEASLKEAMQLNSEIDESDRTSIKRAFHIAAASNNESVVTFAKMMVPDSQALERYSTLRWFLSKDSTHPATADLLRHWLGGSEHTVVPNINWARTHGAVRASEAKNEKRFENWLISAGERDRTSPIDPQVLISLPEGKVHRQSTHWVSMFDHPIVKKLDDFELASGTSNIRSEGALKFTRTGNLVFFEGTVKHNWEDDFDWDKGKRLFPGIPFTPEQSEFIRPLREANIGKRFEITARWQRKLTGILQIKNGQLGIEDIKWGDIRPSPGQDLR